MNTIGIDLKSLSLKVEDTAVRLQIWDTQGQDSYFSLTRSYFRNCQGCVVVFDLTDRSSFDCVEQYVGVFKEECPAEALDNILLVGTKLDDVENRVVPQEDAENLCRALNCSAYFETSAQSGINVDEAFFAVAARAYQKTQFLMYSQRQKKGAGTEDNSTI